MVNQCQGCTAGWEVEEHKPWPKGSKSILMHKVAGSSRGEQVVCSKHRYKGLQPQCGKCGKFYQRGSECRDCVDAAR